MLLVIFSVERILLLESNDTFDDNSLIDKELQQTFSGYENCYFLLGSYLTSTGACKELGFDVAIEGSDGI